MIAHSWCSLLVAESFGLLFGRLHSWDHQGNVLVGVTRVFFSADLDAIYSSNRFLSTIYPAKVPRVMLSMIEL